MTFEEVLDQAVAMLQRRGWITYRTLKLQFQLDDETLEALKDELLFSHPVVDQEGRGLVWTGETEAKPESVSTAPVQQEVPQQNHPTPSEPPPTAPHTPKAERRR
jgi:hypothetical protein